MWYTLGVIFVQSMYASAKESGPVVPFANMV